MKLTSCFLFIYIFFPISVFLFKFWRDPSFHAWLVTRQITFLLFLGNWVRESWGCGGFILLDDMRDQLPALPFLLKVTRHSEDNELFVNSDLFWFTGGDWLDVGHSSESLYPFPLPSWFGRRPHPGWLIFGAFTAPPIPGPKGPPRGATGWDPQPWAGQDGHWWSVSGWCLSIRLSCLLLESAILQGLHPSMTCYLPVMWHSCKDSLGFPDVETYVKRAWVSPCVDINWEAKSLTHRV